MIKKYYCLSFICARYNDRVEVLFYSFLRKQLPYNIPIIFGYFNSMPRLLNSLLIDRGVAYSVKT